MVIPKGVGPTSRSASAVNVTRMPVLTDVDDARSDTRLGAGAEVVEVDGELLCADELEDAGGGETRLAGFP